jgi:hypothetical protein
MKEIALKTLAACNEMITRIREVLPLLESTVGTYEGAVFYTWAFRRCKQSGEIPVSSWSYFFHGYECDMKNTSDGRFLRIDFGPGGRTDTVTAWGVLQFIMTCADPWSCFDELKLFFAKSNPPFDQYSGDFHKICAIWDILKDEGCFETADEKLVQLEEKYTTINSIGIRYIEFPATVSEKTQIDCSVAHRKIISQHGRNLIKFQI